MGDEEQPEGIDLNAAQQALNQAIVWAGRIRELPRTHAPPTS